MTITWSQCICIVVIFISVVSEVLADICGDGTRCARGMECCSTGCCDLDSHDIDDRRYTYGYRLSIWNMWYFWFVILFLMMSCFGGCGYYKHRQRFGQPVRDHRSFFSYLADPYSRNSGRVLSLEHGGYPDRTMGGYVISRTPDANLAASMAPPPYTEVVSNPGMFPPNTKIGVHGYMSDGNTPAYGNNIPGNNLPGHVMPQPPPYTEVANQNTADLVPTNHSTGQNQSANQGSDTSANLQ
ncbi:hypothetical protein ACF0H5_018719 [Mactra antiquata]